MSEATCTTVPQADFSVEFRCTEHNRNWLILQIRLWLMKHRLEGQCTWRVNPTNTRILLDLKEGPWLTLFLLQWEGWPYQINSIYENHNDI